MGRMDILKAGMKAWRGRASKRDEVGRKDGSIETEGETLRSRMHRWTE